MNDLFSSIRIRNTIGMHSIHVEVCLRSSFTLFVRNNFNAENIRFVEIESPTIRKIDNNRIFTILVFVSRAEIVDEANKCFAIDCDNANVLSVIFLQMHGQSLLTSCRNNVRSGFSIMDDSISSLGFLLGFFIDVYSEFSGSSDPFFVIKFAVVTFN